MEKKEDPLSNLEKNRNNESDSDTNNAVVPSDNDSIGNYSNSVPDIEVFNKELYNEILEFGFDADKITLAMKLSTDKQQIIDLVMKMNEDDEFYKQMKINAQTKFSPLTNINYKQTEYKMVIVVREDLKMGVGKIAAQVGHAVLGCYKLACAKNLLSVHIWEGCATPKIVLACKSQEELLDLKKKADETGITNCLIADAGRTEVEPGTITCCAFGPEIVNKIDLLTGHLKLL